MKKVCFALALFGAVALLAVADTVTVTVTNDVGKVVTIKTVEGVPTFTNPAATNAVAKVVESVVPSWAKAANKPTYTAAEVGALGNSGNQNLNGELSFWGGNLAFAFDDAVLTPVITLWNGFDRIYFPNQSGTLARLEDIPSVSGLAPLVSPAFTGTPTAPTAASGDNSTRLATTAFVQEAVGSSSSNPLSGQSFDFATMQGVFAGVKACIEALGGSVTNFPTNN